jgi:thiamine transport system substrate-binding protein
MNLIRVMPAEGAMRIAPTRLQLVLVIGLASLFLSGLVSCSRAEEPELLVYTYDSFVAEWGAAPKLAPLFEQVAGVKVRFLSKGDGGQLLSTVILEGRRSEADIVLGLDNYLAPKALSSGLFRAYKPSGYDSVPADLRLDPKARLVSYDYGYYSIIWDSVKLPSPPASLEDLTRPEFKKKLILLDPRSSTPGLGFLAWTKSVYGASWKDYWRRLRPSVLVLAPGWDQGYGLFTSGEAPLVLSYATSPAYHAEYENSERYKALDFPEGAVRQIEAAGILAAAKHPANAERFMDFLVSEVAQRELPLTQWMYPVLPSVALPASYGAALRPSKTLEIEAPGLSEDALEAVRILTGAE